MTHPGTVIYSVRSNRSTPGIPLRLVTSLQLSFRDVHLPALLVYVRYTRACQCPLEQLIPTLELVKVLPERLHRLSQIRWIFRKCSEFNFPRALQKLRAIAFLLDILGQIYLYLFYDIFRTFGFLAPLTPLFKYSMILLNQILLKRATWLTIFGNTPWFLLEHKYRYITWPEHWLQTARQ